MSDILREELVHLTSDLIRFQSTADNPEQLVAVLDYVAHYVDQTPGLYVERSEQGGKPALVVTLHDTRAPTLMLNGHLDVVAAKLEQYEPYVQGGRLYGRASQDMKGSVAVLMRLLKDLAAQDPRPNVGFQFVTDEEIGGKHGTQRLVEEGWHCNFFIAAEPTDLDICYQQKGGVWVRLQIPGTPAHASRPWDGENPLLELVAGLRRLTQRFPIPAPDSWQTTATPTIVHTPGAPNQVQPYVSLHIDVRHIADDRPEDILNAIRECFPRVTTIDHRFVDALVTDPNDPSLQRLAKTINQVAGHTPRVYREHFGSDARFYSVANIPAVCCGPVGRGLHSDEEWVDIASLVQFYNVLHSYIHQ